MIKKVSFVFLLVFLSFVCLNGCDSQDQSGCGSADTSDEIEFELPPASDNGIASYEVELMAPASKESLGTQTGTPGQTLVFTLDRPMVYVVANVKALSASGAVLGENEVGLVDVDVITGICDVTVDVSSVLDSDGTTVDVNVNCFGIDVTDVNVDTRK